MKRLLIWTLVLAAALGVPPVFRSVVWVLLHEEVWRQGGSVNRVKIHGSLWQPLIFSGLRMAVPCADGGRIEFGADRVEVVWQWKALFDRVGNRRFFERLRVLGAKLDWSTGTDVQRSYPLPQSWRPLSFGEPLQLPEPSWLELELDAVSMRSGKTSLRAEGVSLTLSELAPGDLKVAKFEVQLKTWTKNFRDVQGKTSLQGGRVQLGDAVLAEGLRIASLSASLSQVAAGRVDFELQADAFGGELRVLAQSNAASSETPFEASGTFSKLGVAPLAAFLNVTEAAGGVLEAGKFSFRGRPAHPDRGTASLRLEAKNFQWESRQWDSLVLGATLLDHRIQVPEFALRQGHNQLVLNGDVQWPGGDLPWWQADFGVNINARVDNLTELSALILPEFKYAAGALTVDGAVRRQAGVFGGALIVSGANLTWRSAPVEELHAALKLQGAEIQLLNVELTHGADLLRGKGVWQVGEKWSYRGELHGQVRDISKYAALMQPAIASQPYTGGVDVDWSGEGKAGVHGGSLRTQFRRLRPLRPLETWPNPMSGGFSATYSKEGVEVESASLGDEQIQLRTGASFGLLGARLTKFSVLQGQGTVLEGDALLPPEIWKAWPQVDWAAVLKSVAPMQLRLSAKNLNLAAIGRLPGMPRGLDGFLEGDWEMGGTLKEMEGKGAFKLRDAAWASGEGRVSEAGADVAWEERAIRVKNLGWRSRSGRFEGGGAVLWNVEDAPQLRISVACEKAVWAAPFGLQFPSATDAAGIAARMVPVMASGKASWKVSGSLSAPTLSGEVLLRDVDFGGVPDMRWLWRTLDPKLFLVRGNGNRLMRDWRLQLDVSSGDGATVTGTTGAARIDLKAMGTAGAPEWLGEARIALKGTAAGVELEVEPLVLKLAPKNPVPELEIRAHGTVPGQGAFRVNALGPLGHPVREYDADPPLKSETVRGVFEEGKAWN